MTKPYKRFNPYADLKGKYDKLVLERDQLRDVADARQSSIEVLTHDLENSRKVCAREVARADAYAQKASEEFHTRSGIVTLVNNFITNNPLVHLLGGGHVLKVIKEAEAKRRTRVDEIDKAWIAKANARGDADGNIQGLEQRPSSNTVKKAK